MNSLPAALESILFVCGAPIEVKKLVSVVSKTLADVDEAMIRAAISKLEKQLSDDSERGLAIVFDGTRVGLVTKSDMAPIVAPVVRAEYTGPLTPAALETLAIVTYAGPVPRSTIDYVRGVNSSFTLRALLIRGLVERIPDPARPNSYRYQPSFDLMGYLGVADRRALPEFARLHGLIHELDAQAKAGEATEATQEKVTP